jgi:formylglycine-generating enzyme required for sulfatase activity
MGARDTELAAYTTDHVSFVPYSNERPQHRVTLPSYAISKTQVTNAQFRPFVTGNGYSDPAYWSTDGWAWREANDVSAPAFWEDPHYNADNLPVVGVSWYEAQAYSRWLSNKTGADIQMPTEAEWEKAARGTDGRIYPWGDTWDQDQAYQTRTTSGPMDPIAVGSYPAGASPYGVLDMAGNVSEWTHSEHRPYPYDPNDGREDGIDPAMRRFTVRSGGWHAQSIDFRTASRGSLPPDARYYNLGMRLARHPSNGKP